MVKFQELQRSLQNIAGKQISVGVFDEKIAQYALENEFGTDKIPQRSFLRSTFTEEHDNITKKFVDTYKQTNDFDEAMRAAGEYLKERVQAKILQGDFKPNSPQTIARKGSSHPLIDTGALLNSIEYVVK